jgi:hypothetical protein
METMGLSEYPLSVGDDPETIIVDSIGQYAYLLDGGNVHKVNLAEKTYVTFPQPAGTDEIGDFDLTPDGSRAILNDADNWIYLIETSSWTLIDKKQVNTNRFTESGQVAVSPDGQTAIITNPTDPSITFVNITSSVITIMDTIEVGGSADGVAFSKDGQNAVIAVQNPNLVQIIDVPNRQIHATISEKIGLMPTGVAIVEVGEEPAEDFPVVGDINNDKKINLIEAIYALEKTVGIDHATTISGVWKVVSQREECGDDEVFVETPFVFDGITYNYYYEIKENSFQEFMDIGTFPQQYSYAPGIYYCLDWMMSQASPITVNSTLNNDGTTVTFEMSENQLTVYMRYDHEPNCVDTYICSKVNASSVDGAVDSCLVMEDIWD